MIIPRFLFDHEAIGYRIDINGRGIEVKTEMWRSPAVIERTSKSASSGFQYTGGGDKRTAEHNYTLTINKNPIKIGDVVEIKGSKYNTIIRITEISDKSFGGKYMEVKGNGNNDWKMGELETSNQRSNSESFR